MASKSLGTLTVDLIAKVGGFVGGMNEAERKAASSSKKMAAEQRRLARETEKAWKGMQKIVIGAFATVSAAFTKSLYDGFHYAAQMQEQANKLQMPSEELQEIAYVSGQANVNFTELTAGIGRLNRAMIESEKDGSKFNQIFKSLGLSARDAEGNLKSSQQMLLELSDVFYEYDDQVGEAALAMEIFGRSGTNFMDFLNQGSKSIQEQADRARELGFILENETTASMLELRSRTDDVKTAFTVFGAQIMGEFAPVITDLIKTFLDLNAKHNLVEKTITGIKGVIDGAVMIWSAFEIAVKSVITILLLAAETIRSVAKIFVAQGRTIMGVIKGIITLNPNAIRRAISGMADTVVNEFETLKNRSKAIANEMGASIQESIDRGSKAMQEGWILTQQNALDAKNEVEKLNEEVDELKGSKGEVPLIKNAESGAKKATGAVKKLNDEIDKLTQSYNDYMAKIHEQAWFVGLEGTEVQNLEYRLMFGEESGWSEEQKRMALEAAAYLDTLREEQKIREENKRLAEQAIEDEKRRREEVQGIMSDLQLNLDLLGKSADEQERIIMLKELSGLATEEETKLIMEQLGLLQERTKLVEQQVEVMDNLRRSGSQAIQDLISGTKSFGDAFLGILDDINAKILQMIADNLMEQLLGGFGSAGGGSVGGSIGGWIGALFGAGRAYGGNTQAGKIHPVNELGGTEMLTVRGKDFLLMGSGGGNITPAHMVGRGGGISQNNNFIIEGKIDRRTQMQIAQDVGRRSQNAMTRNR